MRGSQREAETQAETQAEGEAGSMHREPDVGFDPGSPGSRPGLKAGAKPLRHPGIPLFVGLIEGTSILQGFFSFKKRFYLFIHETERERGRDTSRGRSRLHAGSLTWDSNLGLQDHALG